MRTERFRKLETWKKAIDYVAVIYQVTTVFPQTERFGLIDQIRRAAVSIALNIAEGSGSGSDPEFIRFLRISLRSVYEVMAALEVAYKLKFISLTQLEQALNLAEELAAMINGLIRRLRATDH